MEKRLKVLIISSVLMIVCLFMAVITPKLMAFGLLQWVIVVSYNLIHDMKMRGITLNGFIKYNDGIAKESWKERKFAKSSLYTMVTPMLGLGISFLVMLLVAAWFL